MRQRLMERGIEDEQVKLDDPVDFLSLVKWCDKEKVKKAEPSLIFCINLCKTVWIYHSEAVYPFKFYRNL